MKNRQQLTNSNRQLVNIVGIVAANVVLGLGGGNIDNAGKAFLLHIPLAVHVHGSLPYLTPPSTHASTWILCILGLPKLSSVAPQHPTLRE